MVTMVNESSVAAAAGLQYGDQLLEVRTDSSLRIYVEDGMTEVMHSRCSSLY